MITTIDCPVIIRDKWILEYCMLHGLQSPVIQRSGSVKKVTFSYQNPKDVQKFHEQIEAVTVRNDSFPPIYNNPRNNTKDDNFQ